MTIFTGVQQTWWVTGVVYGILGIWALGGTSVINEERFSPEGWYQVIQDYKVTVWYTAQPHRMLMGSEVDPKSFDLSSLRYLASVGEPLIRRQFGGRLKKLVCLSMILGGKQSLVELVLQIILFWI